MAKKSMIDDIMIEIRNGLKGNKVILGSEKVLKYLNKGKINKILISDNCKEDMKKNLEYFLIF